MLQPKKTKYAKAHKGRIRGNSKRGYNLEFGDYGLKATSSVRLKANQIEACRRSISRSMKRSGKMWIRVFPDLPVSSKPAEVRMGKGKGAVDHWAVRVAPGRVIFELAGVSLDVAKEAIRVAALKLPMSSRFISRKELSYEV